jgi:hypothetical protein
VRSANANASLDGRSSHVADEFTPSALGTGHDWRLDKENSQGFATTAN